MKKYIFLLTLFSLALVSSLTYSGESISFLVPEQYEYYSIVGNSTPIDLEVNQNGLNVTITIGKYQTADDFEIIFFNNEKEIITRTISSGGSGGSIKYIEVPVNQTEIVYINQTKEMECSEPICEQINLTSEKIVEENNYIAVWICVGLLILSWIIILIYRKKLFESVEENYNYGVEENGE